MKMEKKVNELIEGWNLQDLKISDVKETQTKTRKMVSEIIDLVNVHSVKIADLEINEKKAKKMTMDHHVRIAEFERALSAMSLDFMKALKEKEPNKTQKLSHAAGCMKAGKIPAGSGEIPESPILESPDPDSECEGPTPAATAMKAMNNAKKAKKSVKAMKKTKTAVKPMKAMNTKKAEKAMKAMKTMKVKAMKTKKAMKFDSKAKKAHDLLCAKDSSKNVKTMGWTIKAINTKKA